MRELERAALVANWTTPDSVTIVRPGWFQIITPSSPHRWHNRVVESVMTDEDAPSTIADVSAHYRTLGVDFSWRVGPNARPRDLGALLARQGMVATELVGMVAEVSRLDAELEPSTTIERVGPHNVGDYVGASAAGFGNDAAQAASLRADMDRHVADPGTRCEFFLARVSGEPAGTAALFPVSDDSSYLLGGSVAPAFRKRGIYRALVAGRARVLRARGVRLATIWALAETSAPICRRLGFETVCSAQLFTWPERASR